MPCVQSLADRRRGGPSVVLAVLVLVSFASGAPAAEPLRRGVDLSFLPQVEAGGGVFRDGDALVDPVALLAARGIRTVRLRLWHTPANGVNGLPSTLALAERARDAGLEIALDVHYADRWADPARQDPPAAWRDLDASTLADSVRAYTRDVLRAFAGRGLDVASIQIGNEITSGFLWPTGHVGEADDTPEQWDVFASLLRAAMEGVDASGQDPAVVLHVDRGGDPAGARWFFERLARFDLPFDRIGLSFYPWWHGTLDDLEATIRTLRETTDKQIEVVETAYPWTLAWFDDTHNFVGLPEHVLGGFPATSEGQRAFARALVDRLRALPGVVGVSWWAPEWIASPGFGSSGENLTLFDSRGRPLPALDAFAAP